MVEMKVPVPVTKGQATSLALQSRIVAPEAKHVLTQEHKISYRRQEYYIVVDTHIGIVPIVKET